MTIDEQLRLLMRKVKLLAHEQGDPPDLIELIFEIDAALELILNKFGEFDPTQLQVKRRRSQQRGRTRTSPGGSAGGQFPQPAPAVIRPVKS